MTKEQIEQFVSTWVHRQLVQAGSDVTAHADSLIEDAVLSAANKLGPVAIQALVGKLVELLFAFLDELQSTRYPVVVQANEFVKTDLRTKTHPDE